MRETIVADVERKTPWADLPRELLTSIADRLGIIELLSFRGTCKEWHSSTSSSSAQIESSPNCRPWLIFHSDDSQSVLYNCSEKKNYSIDLPELNGSTCLASFQGWLLLFQEGSEGSIFFFSPFSRAKISLPNFPHAEISDHIAAVSAPPTSENCTVCVINRGDKRNLELNLLRRGSKNWSKIDYACPRRRLDAIIVATHHDGIFYFVDNNNRALTYCVSNNEWVTYSIVDEKYRNESTVVRYMPFYLCDGCFRCSKMRNWLKLGDDVSISIRGTSVSILGGEMVLHNEFIEASKLPRSRHLQGIWIQPRFHQIPPNLSWFI
ncbi:hypothetical protein U1Q18_041413 [Sarracenia purpurea var. burkii]